MTTQDKISFIKEWYKFRNNMCKKYKDTYTECPLYESSDGWRGENREYEYVHNCKYDFEDGLAEDIIALMEMNKKKEVINMIEQDIIILQFVMPYDKILKDENAYWEEDTQTMYSSERYLALREFNKHGFRVLQFVPNRYEDHKAEWVLVEKYE